MSLLPIPFSLLPIPTYEFITYNYEFIIYTLLSFTVPTSSQIWWSYFADVLQLTRPLEEVKYI